MNFLHKAICVFGLLGVLAFGALPANAKVFYVAQASSRTTGGTTGLPTTTGGTTGLLTTTGGSTSTGTGSTSTGTGSTGTGSSTLTSGTTLTGP